jgi:hypothetical protein
MPLLLLPPPPAGAAGAVNVFPTAAQATAQAQQATTNVPIAPTVVRDYLKPTIEVAFNTQPMSTTPIWTDITPYVLPDNALQTVRGRTDEFSRVQPGTISLLIDNSDGRFTRGSTTSPYAPNVRNGRRIRYSYMFGPSLNYLHKPESDFETSTAANNWRVAAGGTGAPAAEQPDEGTRSFKMTANGTGILWALNDNNNFDSVTHGTAGQVFTFGIRLRSASATRSWRAVLRWKTDNNVYHSQTNGPAVSCGAGSYTQLTASGQMPSGATKVLVQFESTTTPANNEIWYADKAQLTKTATLQTWEVGPTRYRRFDGHVNNWPIQWTTSTWAPVAITATDRFKRFGQLGELRSILEEEYLRDAVETVAGQSLPPSSYSPANWTPSYGEPASGCTNSDVITATGGTRHKMGGSTVRTNPPTSSPAGTPPIDPSGTYTNWDVVGTDGTHSAVQWTLQPVNDPTPNGYFWSTQGSLSESGVGNHTFYCGMQSSGTIPGQSNDKVALFAIWEASASVRNTAITNSWAQNFTGEGTGYNAGIPYAWVTGRTYTLKVERETSRGTGWWAAYVTDNTTSIQTWIGSVRVPTHWLMLNGGVIQWTEYFSNPGNLATCQLIPYAEAVFGTPTFTLPGASSSGGFSSVYYPLSEPSGSTSVSSATEHAQASAFPVQLGAAGFAQGREAAIEFATGTGPGTDELSAPMFAPAALTNGKYLQADLIKEIGGGAITLECWFRVSGLGVVPDSSIINRTVVALTGKDRSQQSYLAFQIDETGRLHGRKYRGEALVYQIVSNSIKNDGETHHAVLTETLVGTTVTARMYINNQQVAGTPTYTVTSTALPSYKRITIGGNTWDGDLFTGTISHVAAYSSALSTARIADHYKAGKDGIVGERTDVRIGRLASYIGIPTTERVLDVGDSTVGWQSTSGAQPINAMQDVEETENGVLFMSMDGKLIFHKRSRRYNVAPFLTLNAAFAEQMGMGLELPGDDFGLINDATANRPRNSEVRAVNRASIDEFGLYRHTTTILNDNDTSAQGVVDWLVTAYGDELVRVPNVTIDLYVLGQSNPTLANAVLSAEISHMLRLSNMPTQAPSTTIDTFIEGWTETIGVAEWTISFNCSPAIVGSVWQLGIPGFSELGLTTRVAP